MDANQYVFLHGMRRTRTVLASWEEDPWPVIRTWLLGAVLIALGLLAAVTVAASLIRPDYGFHYGPMVPGGPSPERVLGVLGRNSLVLALHAAACVAGFIAGAALPLSTERRTGLSRLVHEKARPIAFAWVIVQILLLDIVFSLDSVITAVGMVDEVAIMIAAVCGDCVIWKPSSQTPLAAVAVQKARLLA